MSNDRLSLAAQLIRQSPPGQVNDVIADIQVIIGQDPEFAPHAAEQLQLYNEEQLNVVILPGKSEPTITSTAAAIAQVGSSTVRYVDPRAKQTFQYDHLTGKPSDEEEYLIPEEDETFRAALYKSLSAYVSNHYPGGVGSVFCSSRPLKKKIEAVVPAAEEVNEESTKEEQPVMEVDEKTETVEAKDEESATTAAELETAKETSAEPMDVEKPLEETAAVETDETKEEVEEDAKTDDNEETKEEAKKESEEATQQGAIDETAPATEQPLSEQPALVEETPEEPASPPVFTVQIVGNKYNVQNFWTGRWRTEYVIDLQQPQVQGSIKVDVHYFEAGNVQLAANHTASFDLPENATAAASQIITTISKIEAEYQQQLNATYAELGDKAFRSLRRALPITRQKVDWDKVGHWKAARNTATQPNR